MVIVDSCVWIEASRATGDLGVKLALKTLLDRYEAAHCSPVKLEVMGGARKQERAPLAYFFLVIPYVPLLERHWEAAVLASWRLQEHGQHVPWNDLLIAVLAIENKARVYSIDKHFQTLRQELGLRLYEPGYGGAWQPEEEGI
jgi:predicted nucleic acid-binding protein